ncbi:MAG: diguanylate cyclase, partial [Lysobacter sp.]|nr:diguanylate cyclase [Lysobacter sp.]
IAVAPPSSAATTRPLDALLTEAENLRSTGSEKFSERVKEIRAEIDAKPAAATKLQRQRLKYLQAYEFGVYRDRRDQGIEIAKQLIVETKDTGVKYRANALVANFAAINRRFSTGLRYLDRTLDMRDKVADKNVRHEGVAVAAMLYNQYGQHNFGLRYANEILKDSPTTRMRCVAGLFKIESKYALRSLAQDDREIQEAIDLCASIQERMPANFLRAILAKKMNDEGRPAAAIALLEQALKDAEAVGYPQLTAELHSILGELKLARNDVESAESHARQAVTFSGGMEPAMSLIRGYKTLYRIELNRGRSDQALAMYKRYAETELARERDVKTRELAYEVYRHQTRQQSQTIAQLERQKQVLLLEQELEREAAQKARLATVLLLVAVAALVFWALQIKRHQNQLRSLAQTDTLTGIGNRHFFTKSSERALQEAARDGEVGALVMFDLDHFKAINDTYGHGAGDWVLKQVGKVCLAHCRKADYIGRLGGEEFAVLLRGADLAGAMRMAEECRSKLAQLDTRESGHAFVVTASFGVTSTAQSGYDLSRLLSHADQMLYRAKNEGRNRVCAYTAEAAADQRSKRASPTLTVVGG